MKGSGGVGGFTLIELLVVIAIIGILSSIILVSLNSARSKAGDSGISEQLAQMRTQSELVYSNVNSYGPALSGQMCPNVSSTDLFSTTSPVNMLNITKGVIGQAGTQVNTWCVSNGSNGATAWAAAAVLKSGNGFTAWCVDSTGNAKSEPLTTVNTPSQAVINYQCI